MRVGQAAPEFTAAVEGEPITLATYRGKWLVLFFISSDCPSDIALFSERLEEFQNHDTDLLGACTDTDATLWAHIAAITADVGGLGYRFFLDRSRSVARAYGLIDPSSEAVSSGLFIIDPESRLKYMSVADDGVGFSVDEVLRVLQTLQSGRFCLAYWTPGKR
jgi:alkyl hydroperoxide reductase subunit AhpC